MCSTSGNYTNWSWMQNADVFSGNKKNTTAVTPEPPCAPRFSFRQHLTQPNSASPCVPFERQCTRGRREAGERPRVALAPPANGHRPAEQVGDFP